MDFLRTLKKHPKKHIQAKVNGGKPKSRGTRIRRRGTALRLALLLAIVVTQARAEEYYIYQTPSGALVISNKEPPPGSRIIKRLPEVADSEIPLAHRTDLCPIDALCV